MSKTYTLSLDEVVVKEVRKILKNKNIPLSQFVNSTLEEFWLGERFKKGELNE